jgi:hypothetical protein
MTSGLDYESTKRAVASAFTKADPAALLSSGFPADEYRPEIADLTDQLMAGAPLTRHLVEDLLLRWFRLNSPATIDPLFEALKRELDQP